jgi:hypothetical protein
MDAKFDLLRISRFGLRVKDRGLAPSPKSKARRIGRWNTGQDRKMWMHGDRKHERPNS